MSRRRCARCRPPNGKPLHLAHLQFYAYGKDGKRGFSSGAAQLADAVNATPNVTIDVGQVMFRQTVTISCDVVRQYSSIGTAKPRKSVIFDGEVERRRRRALSLQGRQTSTTPSNGRRASNSSCSSTNPAQVFFTTDHPNGAPYTTYPDLFALIMSRDLRNKWMADLPKEAIELTTLPSIEREYSLQRNRDHDARRPGEAARPQGPRPSDAGRPRRCRGLRRRSGRSGRAFRHAHLVFKDGDLVVRDGKITHYRPGRALTVQPTLDSNIDRRLSRYYDQAYGLSRDLFKVPEHAIGLDRCLRGGSMPGMNANGVRIDDSFAEAFAMRGTAILITGPTTASGRARRR